jgi:hypothetical protein
MIMGLIVFIYFTQTQSERGREGTSFTRNYQDTKDPEIYSYHGGGEF